MMRFFHHLLIQLYYLIFVVPLKRVLYSEHLLHVVRIFQSQNQLPCDCVHSWAHISQANDIRPHF